MSKWESQKQKSKEDVRKEKSHIGKLKHSLHELIVDWLYERLKEKYPKHSIDRHVTYGYNLQDKHLTEIGEVDVLRFNPENQTWYFYEIKCHDCERQLNKATEQYHRWLGMFPETRSKGIYVTSERITRLK